MDFSISNGGHDIWSRSINQDQGESKLIMKNVFYVLLYISITFDVVNGLLLHSR